MMLSLLVTLTLVAQTNVNVNEVDDQDAQSFADRLKASHELKKPSAIEDEEETEVKPSHAARPFQVRMTQSVARRR